MSNNNNSILFVGIAAAVLLCGATAGIAIACMNDSTPLTDEQIYNAKYDEGWAAGLADNKNFRAASVAVADSSEAQSVEEFAYWAGYYDALYGDNYFNDYQEYLDYLDWFNGNFKQQLKLYKQTSEPVAEMKTALDKCGVE